MADELGGGGGGLVGGCFGGGGGKRTVEGSSSRSILAVWSPIMGVLVGWVVVWLGC